MYSAICFKLFSTNSQNLIFIVFNLKNILLALKSVLKRAIPLQTFKIFWGVTKKNVSLCYNLLRAHKLSNILSLISLFSLVSILTLHLSFLEWELTLNDKEHWNYRDKCKQDFFSCNFCWNVLGLKKFNLTHQNCYFFASLSRFFFAFGPTSSSRSFEQKNIFILKLVEASHPSKACLNEKKRRERERRRHVINYHDFYELSVSSVKRRVIFCNWIGFSNR